ncbi:MAG: O-antigen/teichoic acid export membrane protein [Psychromonas sp.]|jgi:O-antigen/teichoic acid export membrane protein|uniref:lipopolysaccharide biosynthesis protein n=1 Tax=Psychromonas sp. TaxID=1884585 RepID=UPI0039E71B6E
MQNLESKTTSGVFWSFCERFLSKGIGVITTLFLAWFLVPEDYALIAMLAVFISLSSVLVDAGLGQALIRKLEVSELELNTVFYTNLVLSGLIYLICYFAAPLISEFYAEPRLILLIRVVLFSVFLQSLIVIQKTVLVRALNFKDQLKVILPASFGSSLIAIILAYLNFAEWALIFQIIFYQLFLSISYWRLKLWRPSFQFSFTALMGLWRFASYIVFDSMISIPFQNMYLITLPKYFAAGPVGIYFFAQKIKVILIEFIVGAVQSVTYPALSKLQDDNVRLKKSYRTLIKVTTYLIFPMIMFSCALAPLLFEVLLPENWYGAAIYLQLMLIASILYPINSINLNILKVKGRSDLIFYIGVVKKLIIISIFIYTLNFGIIEIIIGQIAASIINYLPNVYFTSRLINYSAKEQLGDFIPVLIISVLIAAGIYWLEPILGINPSIKLILLSLLALFLYVLFTAIFNFQAYNLAKDLFFKYRNKTITPK